MVSLSILTLFWAIATAVNGQDVIQVDVPNNKLISKDLLNITYTVIGGEIANPKFNVETTYPNSLSIDFIWSDHNNPSNVLSLNVASGLLTDPYPGGLKNVEHKESWKAPNCHFFSRYPPSNYDFSLVFTPIYPTVAFGSAPNVGTAQSALTVPLAVMVDNSTFPKC